MDTPLRSGELILRAELRATVPLSLSTIWRLERRGRFPARIKISDKRIAWRRAEIASWLAEREAARKPAAA